MDIYWKLLKRVFGLAKSVPLLSMPAVVLLNVALLYSFATGGPIAAALKALTVAVLAPIYLLVVGVFFTLWAWVWASILVLATANDSITAEGGLSDATFAVGLIVAVQVCAWKLVVDKLASLRTLRRRNNIYFNNQPLSLAELREIASSMEDPRQCGRCGFGPVDHRGCNNLATHHGEVCVSGRWAHGFNRLSNACPRCGWFVSQLSRWPHWDEAQHTPAGRAVLSARTWGEICAVVRAASKASSSPTLS